MPARKMGIPQQVLVMDDSLYQVLVTGRLSTRIPPQRAIRDFAYLFCIPPDEMEARLMQVPFVLRGRLSFDQAEKYCRVMRRCGIQCEAVRQEEVAGLYPRLFAPVEK